MSLLLLRTQSHHKIVSHAVRISRCCVPSCRGLLSEHFKDKKRNPLFLWTCRCSHDRYKVFWLRRHPRHELQRLQHNPDISEHGVRARIFLHVRSWLRVYLDQTNQRVDDFWNSVKTIKDIFNFSIKFEQSVLKLLFLKWSVVDCLEQYSGRFKGFYSLTKSSFSVWILSVILSDT